MLIVVCSPNDKARLPDLVNKPSKFGFITNRPKADFIFMLLLFAFVLYCAFRNIHTSYDTLPYVNYYNSLDVSFSKFFVSDGYYDLGFEFLTKLFKVVFGDNYIYFLAGVPLINLLLVRKILLKNNSQTGYLSFVIYIGVFGLYYNYIVLRQGLAITCILYGLTCIDKNKIKSLAFFIAACLFHKTLLIALAVFPLLIFKFRINKKILMSIIAVLLIAYVTKLFDGLIVYLINFISSISLFSSFERFFGYMSHGENMAVMGYVVGAFVSYFLLVLFSPDKNQVYHNSTAYQAIHPSLATANLKNKYRNMSVYQAYHNITLFMMLGFLFAAVLPGESIITRIIDIFCIPAIILAPQAMAKFKQPYQNIIYALILLVRISIFFLK